MFWTRWFNGYNSGRGSSGRAPRPAARDRRKGRPPSLEPLEERCLLSASLVRDINLDTLDANPGALANINGTLFFRANDAVHGDELWKSDGTPAGTVLVKDIRPGSVGSSLGSFVNVNGTLFFTADGGGGGYELWKSDGTEAGTVLVKDIVPGNPGSSPGQLTNVNGTLFFVAGTAATGRELWKSDGTEAGTVLVKDIRPGTANSDPASLTDVNGTLFFTAQTADAGRELWRSDGTEAGTYMVRDVRPGTIGSNLGNLVNVNGTLFFRANDGVTGEEIWKSDGTPDGTVLVADFRPGTLGISPASLVNVSGTLFFTAELTNNNRELFKSDGTAAGTVVVRDIRPGSVGSNPLNLTAVGSTLFFTANDGVSGTELWKSDGTEAGTVLVKDVLPGVGSPAGLSALTASGGTLFFAADDGVNGRELWKSDGTEAGTVLVKDVFPGGTGGLASTNSFTAELRDVNGTLFFTSANPRYGTELWKTDGTEAGTALVKDVNTNTNGSDPAVFANLNGTLFFAAADKLHGRELWKSDGTEAGTSLFLDLVPGAAGSNVSYLNVFGGSLYFTARSPDVAAGMIGLWKTDGTPAGTVLLRQFNHYLNAGPHGFTALGDTLFFFADDAVNGFALWKTDGTADGTVMVKDVNSQTQGIYTRDLVAGNGRVFFRGNDGTTGWELWTSDGTEAGTYLVKDIRPGGSAFPEYSGAFVAMVNGTLYFAANDGTHGAELWKSDGTEAGTALVKDIRPGSGDAFSSGWASFFKGDLNGTFFFMANDGGVGEELWKSDGTPDGTVLVKDLLPGAAFGGPGNLTLIGSTVFFTAAASGYYGDGDVELWKTDGTTAGTVLVKDINPGGFSGFPKSLGTTLYPSFTDVNGTAYFVANDGTNGWELWKSDGTAAGTVLVQDINPGSGSAFRANTLYPFLLVNGTLFFAANDGARSTGEFTGGTELWALPVVAPTPDLNWSGGGLTAPSSVVAGSSFTVTRTYTVSGAAVTSDFTIAYYGSVNSVFGDADDFLLGTETITAAAGKAVGTHTGTSPTFTISTAGTYFVFARLDDGGQVAESSETNNVAQATVAVTPPSGADLNWANGGILVATPVQAGAAFQVSRTYAVSGAEVAAFVIGYYASLDDVFGNEDDFLLGTEAVSDPGGRSVGSHPGASPAFVLSTPGTYYVFARLDDGGQVAESDETNNVAVAPTPVEVLP